MNRQELEIEATRIMRSLAKKLSPSELLDEYGASPNLLQRLSILLSKAHLYQFPKADHTTDAAVFGLDVKTDLLKILLVKREVDSEPYHGYWALPGGFINLDEDLEICVRRQLAEKTGIKLSYLEQLYTFGRPDRDPRGRVISTAYLALVRPQSVSRNPNSKATSTGWFPIDELPPLAFDHLEIVQKAVERLRSKVRWQPVGLDLLPPKFTLTELQRVYEIVLGRSLDKRNFRRKMLSIKVLLPTGLLRRDGQHRPAMLYTFDQVAYQALLTRGFDFEL